MLKDKTNMMSSSSVSMEEEVNPMKTWDGKAELQVKNVFAVVVTIIIALLLLPLVTDAVDAAKGDLSGASSTLADMIPIFYAIGVVLLAVLWLVAETRKMGG
jgi:hypothetical protein